MSSQPSERPAFDGDTVRLELDNAVTIAEFLERRKREGMELDFAQCLTLVNEAILLLEGLYVHLPVKRAMYAVDPVRRLQLLKFRLDRYDELQRRMAKGEQPKGSGEEPPRDDLWFHREMTDAITSVRDLHTMYVLPKPFDRAVAFLPFQIECYFEENERKYMVSNVIEGLAWFTPPEHFARGVEVTRWNGIPMPRAVDLAGERNAGSNPDARLARGLARLTIRPLAKALPPDEEYVTVHYKTKDGQLHCLRDPVPWHVAPLQDAECLPLDGATIRDHTEGLDYESDVIRILNKHLYSPLYPRPHRKWSPHVKDKQPIGGGTKGIEDVEVIPADETMRDVMQASTFRLSEDRYGYVRLRTFKIDDPELFLDEFAALVASMPDHGLIIDIRDNPGGYIYIGERLLQLLTPRRIQPETAQFINTPLSLSICDVLDAYEPWRESIRRALESGTTYSSAHPLTDVADCNGVGQRYYGPVVLITNALCYSTSDIFAAGFQDHEIGTVLGTGGSTGAGGGNVVTHSWLRTSIIEKQPSSCPLKELPSGDLRFAIRRMLRVGARAGTELEDLGVIPDISYRMTRDDLLNGNVDLIREAVRTLAGKPSYRLQEIRDSVRRVDKRVVAEIETLHLARLDLAVDGWASRSQQIEDGKHDVCADLPPNAEGKILELRGFDGNGCLVAARKVRLT
jgi:C-terminal processing protease CtpA/Prc